MTFPAFHYNPGQEPPFTVFIEHQDKAEGGRWNPQAFVMLTSTLRTSGFLLALPPEELQSFLLLLTFLTPNGEFAATLPQVSEAFRLAQPKARARMGRLLAATWHGQPIVLPHRFGNDEAFAPVPGLLPVREEGPQEPVAPAMRVAPREAVIEHSRRTYAKPRAEVERRIAELNGWPLPDEAALHGEPAPAASKESSAYSQANDPQAELRAALLGVGLLPHQAEALLSRYDALRIRRQLAWLPYRGVRNSAGFLIAAVKDDYEAPRALAKNAAPQQDATSPPASAVPPEDGQSVTLIPDGE